MSAQFGLKHEHTAPAASDAAGSTRSMRGTHPALDYERSTTLCELNDAPGHYNELNAITL